MKGGLIEYKQGELLGENKHTFIKEVAPNVYKMRGYDRKTRRALFKCGLCGCKFENTIQLIKTDKVKSCGCLQRESVKNYFKGKRDYIYKENTTKEKDEQEYNYFDRLFQE